MKNHLGIYNDKHDFIDKNQIHLENLEFYYKIFLENINDLISILNKNFEFEIINEPTFKKVLGYSEKDLIGNPFLSIIHPDDVKNDINITKEDILRGNPPLELRFQHKEGHYLSFEIKGNNFYNDRGHQQILVISKLIMERKILEEKLSENKQNYERISENINDLIVILNDQYYFEYINGIITLNNMRYTKKDLIETTILNYIHPDDIEFVLDVLNKRFNIPEKKIEFRLKQKDGGWIWFDCHGTAYFEKRGNLKWLLILRNISEQLLAEERYKNIFDNSPGAIILIDYEGKIVDSNTTFLKLFGLNKESFISKTINDFNDIFSSEIKFYFKKIFQAAFKNEFPESIDVEIKNINNSKLWVRIQAALFKIGNKLLIQFIFHDITEKKKGETLKEKFKEELETEVQVRTRELNEALAQQKLYLDQILKTSQFKTDFMSTMSHELRTPLNAIIGFSDLLLEELYGTLNEQQLEFIRDIKSSAEHQFDMIKNILDISKIESGQINLNIQKFVLNNIVDQIKSTLRPLYKKKGLKFKVKGLETVKEIYADPIRFKEILFNLLDNAVKYSMRGQITLTVQEKYDHWLFKVSDNGIGIASKDFDLIFKEFKRVDSTFVRSVPGTGLGLSLTKRLVNLHSGEISFYSVIGAGTTFTFSILKKLEQKSSNV